MEQHYRTSAIRFVAVLLLATAAAASNAYDPLDDGFKPDALEIPRLPAYCQGQFNPELAKVPGHTLPAGCGVWINHFCPAIVALNRAGNPTLPMKARVYALQGANGHLRYTREHLQPTCPLKDDLQVLESRARLLRIMVK